MVVCTSLKFYFEWGAVVFEFYVPPFWSQSFRFAQTDGIFAYYTYYTIATYVYYDLDCYNCLIILIFERTKYTKCLCTRTSV